MTTKRKPAPSVPERLTALREQVPATWRSRSHVGQVVDADGVPVLQGDAATVVYATGLHESLPALLEAVEQLRQMEALVQRSIGGSKVDIMTWLKMINTARNAMRALDIELP